MFQVRTAVMTFTVLILRRQRQDCGKDGLLTKSKAEFHSEALSQNSRGQECSLMAWAWLWCDFPAEITENKVN